MSQGNIFTALLGGLLGAGLTLAVVARLPNAVYGHVAIWTSYGFGAIFMSMPFNPLRRTSELTAVERRILFAFFDPPSRRRAGVFVLLVGALTDAAYVAIRVFLKPEVTGSESVLVVLFFVCGVRSVAIMWVGLYGLTMRMRRHWKTVVSSGPEWPADVEYPGPRWDALNAVLSDWKPTWLD